MGGDENQEERIRKNRKEERDKWVSVSNHFHLTFKYQISQEDYYLFLVIHS